MKAESLVHGAGAIDVLYEYGAARRVVDSQQLAKMDVQTSRMANRVSSLSRLSGCAWSMSMCPTVLSDMSDKV